MSEVIPGFMIYLADLKAFSDQLSKESMGAVMFALMYFAETGTDDESGLSQVEIICYRVMRNNIIRDHARYQKKAMAGARGGSISKKNSALSKNESASSKTESASVIPIPVPSPNPDINPSISPVVVVSPTKPTREEVLAYAATKTTTTDPDRFFDYYEARGWELKPGVPVKNWKAVFNVWMKNEGRFKDGNGTDQGESGEYPAPGQGVPYIGV